MASAGVVSTAAICWRDLLGTAGADELPSAATWNGAFAIVDEAGAALGQPGLDPRSFYSYDITLSRPWLKYRETDFVLLANIAPGLQSHVLDQMKRPRFVVADTMDLWIETTRADLDALLPRVDLLILNDSEARELTKETSLIKAGRKIRQSGRKYVAIKKGEHGALLFG